MKKSILLLSIIWLICISCTKQETTTSSENYYTFGHYYGECSGEYCVEIFKLTESEVLEDSKDIYPNSQGFYDGAFTSLSTVKYNAVKDFGVFFPDSLLLESTIIIGLPDAGDWGGLYIEYNQGGVQQFWLLDQLKSNVPNKYHAFIDTVNSRISLLQ